MTKLIVMAVLLAASLSFATSPTGRGGGVSSEVTEASQTQLSKFNSQLDEAQRKADVQKSAEESRQARAQGINHFRYLALGQMQLFEFFKLLQFDFENEEMNQLDPELLKETLGQFINEDPSYVRDGSVQRDLPRNQFVVAEYPLYIGEKEVTFISTPSTKDTPAKVEVNYKELVDDLHWAYLNARTYQDKSSGGRDRFIGVGDRKIKQELISKTGRFQKEVSYSGLMATTFHEAMVLLGKEGSTEYGLSKIVGAANELFYSDEGMALFISQRIDALIKTDGDYFSKWCKGEKLKYVFSHPIANELNGRHHRLYKVYGPSRLKITQKTIYAKACDNRKGERPWRK